VPAASTFQLHNEMGVESFRGKRFHPSTVRNMVSYLGVAKHGIVVVASMRSINS
jgi:hypothetical protein